MGTAATDGADRRVFLSHATPDQPFIEEHILPVVRRHTDAVFYSKVEIKGGEVWQNELREELDAASHFVVVVSRDSLDPLRYVQDELGWWIEEHPDGAGLIPVLIDDSRAKDLGLRLVRRHYVDFRSPGPEAEAKLDEALAGVPPATPVASKVRAVSFDPRLRSSYAGWLVATQRSLEATIAGEPVSAALADAPMPDRLYEDRSSAFGREQELSHFARRADALQRSDPTLGGHDAETRALSVQPLPLYMGPTARLDDLGLADRASRTVDDLMARSWRAVLLGDPGSGKTTVARRLAREVALARLEDPPVPGPRDRLPVLCRAADLARLLEAEEGPVEELAIVCGWDGSLPHDLDSGDPLPPEDLRAMASREAAGRRLLLVVDGLDEVPRGAARARVVAGLVAFAERGGSALGTPQGAVGNQVVVTSRIVGYHATALTGRLRFDHLLLGPLSPEATRQLADFWLGAHAEALALPEARRRAVDAAVDRFLDREDRLSDLVANPFLLTSAVSGLISGRVDTERQERRWLRSDLYDAVLADAVARAVRRRPGLDVDRGIALQLAVAFHLHARAASGVMDGRALDDAMTAAAGEVGIEPDLDELHALVLDGFALVTERGKDLFGFLHLSIGEHLAGRWLLRDDGAAARVEERLGDPRWVEPLRLALGHLSRHDPGRFDELVARLLEGAEGWLAAVLLVTSVDDVDRLAPEHVEAVVAALSGGPAAAADEAVRMLVDFLAALEGGGGGGRGDGIVPRALCDAVRSPDPARAAVGARVVRALGLEVPEVLVALFEAQERDGAATDWELATALQALLSSDPADAAPPDPDLDSILADATDHDRDLLRRVGVPEPAPAGEPGRRRSRRDGGRRRRRAGLPRELTPMRNALLAEPDLVEHVLATPPWTRAVLCLYGGSDHADVSRWRRERDWLQAELDDPGSSEPARHRAARRLDTEVVPRLVRAQEAPVRFEPRLISTDSPLTPVVLDQLRRRASAEALSGSLRALALDGERPPAERGDAVAALVALGVEGDLAASPLDDLDGRSGGPAGDAVRRRVAWRLGRSAQLVEDVLTRVPAGDLVEAFGDGEDPRAGRALSALAALTRPRLGGFSIDRNLVEFLLTSVIGWGETPEYNLAIAMDTRPTAFGGMDGGGLVELLGSVHLSPGAAIAAEHGWLLDPLGPRLAPLPGEALSNLAALPPGFAFVLCWAVRRMAPALVETGFGEEAAALALGALPDGPDRALGAIHALVVGGLDLGLDQAVLGDWIAHQRASIVDLPLPAELAAALRGARRRLLASAASRLEASQGGDVAYPALRALLRLAGGRAAAGSSLDAGAAVRRIEDPLTRLRFLELARDLGLDADGLEDEAAAALDAVEPPAERARAHARVARWTVGGAVGGAVDDALASIEEVESESERADLLSMVRDLVRADAGAAARWRDAAGALRSSPLRARARGRLADDLLDRERSGRFERPLPVAGPAAGAPAAPAPDVETTATGLRADVDGIGAALLAAAEGGAEGRLALAASLDALGPAVGERGSDWMAALAGLAMSPERARRMDALGWHVLPLRRFDVGDVRRAAALASDALAALPAELAFLDEALSARIALPETDLALQWLARFAARSDAEALGRRVVGQVSAARGEAAGDAYAELWRAWRSGAGGRAVRRALEAVVALPPFAGDPWLRARALLAAPREQLDAAELIGVLEGIDDPACLVDALHGAALRVHGVALDDDLRQRWAGLGRRALACAGAMEDPDDRLAAIALLGPLVDRDATGHAALLAAARQAAAGSLVEWLAQTAARTPKNPVGWAALTLGAVARDGLAVLQGDDAGGRSAAGGWEELGDPGRRAAAVAALVERGTRVRWELTPAVARAVDGLLAAGDHGSAAELLPAIAAPREALAVQPWREGSDRRVADRATLLSVEAGRLDEAAVASVPRLLEDEDDLVRLRTAVAIAAVARGGVGRPRFRYSEIGAGTVAALVRAHRDAAADRPVVASELLWCLEDLIVDSLPVLEASLELLAGEPALRRRLLSELTQVDLQVAPDLLRLAPALSDRELAHLLKSIRGLAQQPARAGLGSADLRPLYDGVVRLVRSETDADETIAAAAHALGWLVESGDDLAPLEDLVEDDVESVAAAATLSLAVAVARVGDDSRVETAIADLLALAEQTEGLRAVAAVGGLARLGVLPERACVHLEPGVVVRGLLASYQWSTVWEGYWLLMRRVTAFVLEPSHLTGRDATLHTQRLVDGLLDEVAERLTALLDPDADETASGWGDAGVAPYVVDDPVSVLAEVGLRQPAALREGVARRRTDLPETLARAARDAPRWLVRRGAVTSLCVLGEGDRDTVEALLSAAADTQSVSDAALAASRWIERVDDDGFEGLLGALDDRRSLHASTAARVLGSLARHGALDAEQRRRTVAAVREAVTATPPERRILVERGGRIVDDGSLVAELSAALAALVAGGDGLSASRDAAGCRLLEVPTTAGSAEPVALVTIADGPLAPEPIDYQARFQREHRRERLDDNTVSALTRLGQRCGSGRGLVEALRRLAEPEGAKSEAVD
ncbi:MAG TPA: TIR domain-containing protein [Thermoleophilaceae bacterium]